MRKSKREILSTAATTLMELTGRPPQIEVVRRQRLPLGETCNLRPPLHQWSFTWDGTRCHGWMTPGLLLWCVNVALGGSGQTDDAVRELSELERKVGRTLLSRLSSAVCGSEVSACREPVLTRQSVRARVRVPATILELDIRFASGERTAAGRLVLLIPTGVSGTFNTDPDPVAGGNRPSPGEEEDEQEIAGKNSRLVAVQVLLGRVAVTQHELLELQRGDIVVLDKRASEPVDLYVDGELRARAEAMIRAGKLAVSVCRTAGEEDGGGGKHSQSGTD